MDNELKPCWFCSTGWPEIKSNRQYAWVQCCGCYASGPPTRTEAEAITAWNTRPAPVVTDEMVKNLKALADSINGNCYLGEEWERKTVNALLAALGAGHE